ncbi:MAG: hypothetical protein J1F03_05755 [Oscillospiraceae bacterium]|nr:hypothetical protein [Oscillospiraceae bacterium]
MQLNYCFKKEWSQFIRTFKLTVMIIVFLAVSVSLPALFGFTNMVLNQMEDMPIINQVASVSFDGSGSAQTPNDILSGIGMDEVLEMYSDAGTMFAITTSSINSTGALVAMLLLMPAAGGEQKKRAMIVPMCSGLSYKNYLIPKFVIYPISIFAVTFLSVCVTGFLCNGIFPNNHVSFQNIMLSALLAAVYVVFLTTVYLSLGLCTSRPGIMTASVYIGSSIVETLLVSFGLVKFHPFAISSIINQIGMIPDFPIEEEALNIVVSIAIAVIICVMMFFLALGVLSAKKINNREEVKPEF